MQIGTTRFGMVQIEMRDIVLFPSGLIGYEDSRHWVVLGDAENDAVAWLQCVAGPDLAMPVVSPRRFVPEYQLRVGQSQLEPLQLSEVDEAFVLSIMSKSEDGNLTLNLKAPIIVNLDRRLGRQVITTDDQPIQHYLTSVPSHLRKSA